MLQIVAARPMPANATLALARIRQLIETGELGAAGRLPTERELSESLSVGRRAVRRALEALEAEGLIWRRQGKGTFAGQPTHPLDRIAVELAQGIDLAAMMEARLCIEPALARFCAERALPEDVVRLRRLASRTRAAVDRDEEELWDGSLHRLIARAASNPPLLAAFTVVDEARAGADWYAKRERARRAETVALYHRQHHAIVEAIADGDGAAAESVMAAHLTLIWRNLDAALAQEGR